MWILRFHLLESKDYNKLSRICKKYGFVPRRYSPALYCKASIKYMTQKYSWRMLGREFQIDHRALYKFYENMKDSGCFEEIFHVFLQGRYCLYIGKKKHITSHQLHNSQELYLLTQMEIDRILKEL